MSGWWLPITAGFALWAIVMAVVIVLQRRSPAATIAWMLVLAFLPFLGWFVYRLIGPRRLERKKLRRRMNRKLIEEAEIALHDIESGSPMRHREQLAQIALAAGEPPPLRAASIELYCEGEAAFRGIGDAIGGARHHVHLEYYIWGDDRSGRRLRDQLVTCAQRGLEVRVIVDGTGSGVHRRFWRPLVEAGGEVTWFNPVSLWSFGRRRADFRSHRKLVVCDGEVGFLGGMNMADTETAEFSGEAAWRDTHVRLTGSTVRALQRIFVEDWAYCVDRVLPFNEPYFPAPTETGGDVVQIVSSGPDLATFAIHKTYFAAINQASHRVWLTTPYFVPDEPILSAIVSAAMRGVDVRLIVPAKGDSRLVDLAARSYYPEILDAGVQLYEYLPRFVHSKTMVIDDDVAIVASANLDNRSFRLDFELAAVIYAAAVNTRLADAFTEDLTSCRRVGPEAIARLRFFPRLFQAGARLLSPLL